MHAKPSSLVCTLESISSFVGFCFAGFLAGFVAGLCVGGSTSFFGGFAVVGFFAGFSMVRSITSIIAGRPDEAWDMRAVWIVLVICGGVVCEIVVIRV